MRLFPRRAEPADAGPSKPEIKKAYDLGRHDERARHHSHPILGLIIAGAAVVGVGAVGLGVYEGSFSRAGQVVDANLAAAANHTQVASSSAAQSVAAAGQTSLHNDQQR
jgi:hypothetical protein